MYVPGVPTSVGVLEERPPDALRWIKAPAQRLDVGLQVAVARHFDLTSVLSTSLTVPVATRRAVRFEQQLKQDPAPGALKLLRPEFSKQR